MFTPAFTCRSSVNQYVSPVSNVPAQPTSRSVLTELKNSTYYARLILQQQNELGRKIVEIDARPSDCIALATAQKRPLYVASALFNQVEDMSKWLEEINENGGESE